MELSEYGSFADKCFRDTLPPCAAVCPLAYDVREFIKQMRKGSLRSAYKVIRSTLIFPSVISEICPQTCRSACVRGHIAAKAADSRFAAADGAAGPDDSCRPDESIDLRGLEKICIEKMAGKDPERYNIPQKQQHIAVIGAGLSGLACAYRLASFGYQVKVFERCSLAGGTLPQGLDRRWAHDEIMREFKAVRCGFEFETEISSLCDLGDEPAADAVYIATGEGGNDFRSAADDQYSGLVLRGGALAGTDIMESVRTGLTAAEMINNRLLTNVAKTREEMEISVPERAADPRFYDLHYDLSVPDEIPAKGVPEAFRCMRCNCSECYDVCPLMERHRQYPKKICNEVIVTLKPNKSKRSAVRLIMGCTECSACRTACPENIDMGRCIQEARTDFYESGVMSPAFHDYWLQDMEFCESDEARLLMVKDESRPADVLYFPGCQLPASMPELVEASFEALGRTCDNPAVLLGCCGVPAKWAGHRAEFREVRKRIASDWESLGRPALVTACPSCLQNMKDMHPDMVIQSYYSFAAEHPEILDLQHRDTGTYTKAGADEDTYAGADAEAAADTVPASRIKVIDPCSSIAESNMAECVRRLLKRSGYEIINKETDPACCGFGGHIYNAVPALHDSFAQRRIDDIKDDDVIAASYCANCRDILAYRGADARHVLGLLLGINEEKRMPPELGARRDNRRMAKSMLTGCPEPAEDKAEDKTEDSMEILISEELIRRMDRELILREQISDLITEAEDSGNKLYDEDDNVFIAHKRSGAVTIWAVYSREADSVTVENVYLHRMDIREDI